VLLAFKIAGRRPDAMALLPTMSSFDSMVWIRAAPLRSPTRTGARTDDRASNSGQQSHLLRYDFAPMSALYNLFYIYSFVPIASGIPGRDADRIPSEGLRLESQTVHTMTNKIKQVCEEYSDELISCGPLVRVGGRRGAA
jgi:hypothetical protein